MERDHYAKKIPGSLSKLYKIMKEIQKCSDWQSYDALDRQAMELEFEAQHMQFLIRQHLKRQ